MADTVISAATSSSDTPINHVMTFQFTVSVFRGKVIAPTLIYQYKNVYLCIDKINQAETHDTPAATLYHRH